MVDKVYCIVVVVCGFGKVWYVEFVFGQEVLGLVWMCGKVQE